MSINKIAVYQGGQWITEPIGVDVANMTANSYTDGFLKVNNDGTIAPVTTIDRAAIYFTTDQQGKIMTVDSSNRIGTSTMTTANITNLQEVSVAGSVASIESLPFKPYYYFSIPAGSTTSIYAQIPSTDSAFSLNFLVLSYPTGGGSTNASGGQVFGIGMLGIDNTTYRLSGFSTTNLRISRSIASQNNHAYVKINFINELSFQRYINLQGLRQTRMILKDSIVNIAPTATAL